MSTINAKSAELEASSARMQLAGTARSAEAWSASQAIVISPGGATPTAAASPPPPRERKKMRKTMSSTADREGVDPVMGDVRDETEFEKDARPPEIAAGTLAPPWRPVPRRAGAMAARAA